MAMFLRRERSLLVVGLWGEVLEVWQLVCSIKNKVPVPCCLLFVLLSPLYLWF